MAFVKLDCGILNSTLWFDRAARELFLTALLMAEPRELETPLAQIEIGGLSETGFVVPAGWYGFVAAAGVGIIHRAMMDEATGMEALQRLGEPEVSSRSPEFDGRRLVRVNGGFIVLNFMRYRERDYTTAERSRRYRERKSQRDVTKSHRDITQAEAEAEVQEEVRTPLPPKGGRQRRRSKPPDIWDQSAKMAEMKRLMADEGLTKTQAEERVFGTGG